MDNNKKALNVKQLTVRNDCSHLDSRILLNALSFEDERDEGFTVSVFINSSSSSWPIAKYLAIISESNL